jgi:hypothetical protein
VDIMGLRFNPPPGWPPAPEGFVPQPGWQPDPSWPPPPPGWPLWVDDQQIPARPPPPGSGKTSGWAVASLVVGLVGGVPFSAIFGVVALRRIKRLGQQGRALAIAGLILSGAWIVIFAVIGIVANLGNATRSPTTGRIIHSGSLSVLSLAVGDCFNYPSGATSLTSVTAIPCGQAHSAQVYAKFNVSGSDSSYPGTATLTGLSVSGCKARVGSLDRSEITNSMTLRYLYPEPGTWSGGNHAVACFISNPAADITSSLLNP